MSPSTADGTTGGRALRRHLRSQGRTISILRLCPVLTAASAGGCGHPLSLRRRGDGAPERWPGHRVGERQGWSGRPPSAGADSRPGGPLASGVSPLGTGSRPEGGLGVPELGVNTGGVGFKF